ATRLSVALGAEVEQQYLGIFRGARELERASFLNRNAVALAQLLAVEGGCAARDLHPGLAAGIEVTRDGFALGQHGRVEIADPVPMLSLCSSAPSKTYDTISMSACGCAGKPSPPATRSSLMTRSGPKPMCAGSK